MKLLFGVVGYMVVVAVIAVAASVGVLAVVDHRATEQPVVLASGTDGRGTVSENRSEETRDDPNRVPVWIVPTAKYQYAPVPVEPPKQRAVILGDEARGAKARLRDVAPSAQAADARATPRATYSSRDTDPFFRD